MKKVVITGGSGFVGRRLVEELIGRGDQVTVLTRDPSRAQRQLAAGARSAAWTPEREGAWTDELEGADAVVHLAGETVAQRWTPDARRRIVASRVDSTRVLVEAIGRRAQKPSVLVSASAVGFYGARPPAEELDETSAPGEGFLADVVQRWEAAAQEATKHGVRSVQLRIGVVLGEGGGAVEKMIPPFRFFIGGPIGDGKQVMPWIHRDDVVGLTLFAIDDARVEGPINAVAPHPATGAEVAKAIGRVLHRPSWLPAPSFAVKLVMGGEAASVVLTGQRVLPKRALALGYQFRQAELEPALASILDKG
ncbi:MAG: TIGR01777 family oxidoreductase [Minicystis sp.]